MVKGVSVIIPCHNQAEFLAESILSVQAQTVKPYEIIIVDDGSTDQSKTIAQSFPVKYIFQNHMGNHTPANAMTTGILHSTGDFIVCFAADDKLEPTYLEKCLNLFTSEKIGCVYTGCQEFGASNKLRVPRSPKHKFSGYRNPQGQIGAMMLREEVYQSVGLYDLSLHSLEDWDLFIRVCLKGWKVRSIKEPLHYARIHEGRVTEHSDVSELYRKYRFMRFYIVLSRVFDATLLCLFHPKLAFSRLLNKRVKKW